MERIAIFGGTFNPIHNGHIRLAGLFREKLSLNRMIFMPTHKTPAKEQTDLASDTDRLEMCRLAIKGENGFEVSDYEIRRGGISYTVHTLRHFRGLYPSAELYFVMGSDMFLTLEKWYCFEEILSLAGILTASRHAEEYARLTQHAEVLEKYGARTIILDAPPLEISSTQIRNLAKDGKDFTCYLQESVVQYIRNKKMYL